MNDIRECSVSELQFLVADTVRYREALLDYGFAMLKAELELDEVRYTKRQWNAFASANRRAENGIARNTSESAITGKILMALFFLGSPATFIYLVVSDWDKFNAWNWVLIIPLDMALAAMWPIYWAMQLIN